MTTAYDLRWIMTRAWAEMRRRGRYTRHLFRLCLRAAWSDAKALLRGARLSEDLSPAQRELVALENRDRLSDADRARIAELKARAGREKAAQPVWDVAHRACRSINLATVSPVAVDGRAHTFA